MTEEEAKDLVVEARTLLDAAWHSTDEKRYDQLISWVRELLEPLVKANYPPALWLKCSLPYDVKLTGEEVDKLHRRELEEAAQAGSAEAQFALAVELDEEPTIEKASLLFEKAAEAGHAYSMWCHGLNLLSGRGTDKNQEKGLSFIVRSAEQKFEGAIIFMADACANGTYGQAKSEANSALWWKKLSDPDVIRY